MTYHIHKTGQKRKKSGKRYILIAASLFVLLACGAGGYVWHSYTSGLKPVGTGQTVSVTIEKGESLSVIASKLKAAGLIRDARMFEYYARLHKASQYLQAGTYEINPSQSSQNIIAQLTHGKVATSLVTILPGQRLDQIRESLINQGFSAESVDKAFQPSLYANDPLFVSKPSGNNLEGFMYPNSFQRTAETDAKSIVEQSIAELKRNLTPSIMDGFTKQGLTVYQGLIIASIVEQEVINQTDRAQAAQVFLKRLRTDIPLGSDVTAFYGSTLAGKGKDVTYDTPFNTRIHPGLPPTPISNVSKSSLSAVANPAKTDWLFFVSGDDGTTYFSKTVQEHESLTKQYCIKLCQ